MLSRDQPSPAQKAINRICQRNHNHKLPTKTMKRLSKSIKKTTSTISVVSRSSISVTKKRSSEMRDMTSRTSSMDHSFSSLEGSFHNHNPSSEMITVSEAADPTMLSKKDFEKELRKEMKELKKNRVKSYKQKKALRTMGDIDEASEQARKAEELRRRRRSSQEITGSSSTTDDVMPSPSTVKKPLVNPLQEQEDGPSTPVTVCSTTRGSIPQDLEITITLPDLGIVEQQEEEEEGDEDESEREAGDIGTKSTTLSSMGPSSMHDSCDLLPQHEEGDEESPVTGWDLYATRRRSSVEPLPQPQQPSIAASPSPTLAPTSLTRAPSALIAKPSMRRRSTLSNVEDDRSNRPKPLRRMVTSVMPTTVFPPSASMDSSSNNPLALWMATSSSSPTPTPSPVKKEDSTSTTTTVASSSISTIKTHETDDDDDDESDTDSVVTPESPTASYPAVTSLLSSWDDDIGELEESTQALQAKIQQLQSQLEETQQLEVEQVWLVKGAVCQANMDAIREQVQFEHKQQQQQQRANNDNNDPHLQKLLHHRQAQDSLVDALQRENKARRRESQALNLQMVQLTNSNVRLETATRSTQEFNRELQLLHIRTKADRHKTLLRELQDCQREQLVYERDVPKAILYQQHERRVAKIYRRGTQQVVNFLQERSFDRRLIASISEMPPAVLTMQTKKKRKGDQHKSHYQR